MKNEMEKHNNITYNNNTQENNIIFNHKYCKHVFQYILWILYYATLQWSYNNIVILHRR